MKWKDVKKYKIDLEQAEETGGFIVFEEYEDWKGPILEHPRRL